MDSHRLELDLHRLDLRIAGSRLVEPQAVARIAQSIERCGQVVPCIVVPVPGGAGAGADPWVLVDGYRRVAALRRLGRDTASVERWTCGLAEAGLGVLARAQDRSFAAIEEALMWTAPPVNRHSESFFTCCLTCVQVSARSRPKLISFWYKYLGGLGAEPPNCAPLATEAPSLLRMHVSTEATKSRTRVSEHAGQRRQPPAGHAKEFVALTLRLVNLPEMNACLAFPQPTLGRRSPLSESPVSCALMSGLYAATV